MLRAHEEKGRETDSHEEKTEELLIFKGHLSSREYLFLQTQRNHQSGKGGGNRGASTAPA